MIFRLSTQLRVHRWAMRRVAEASLFTTASGSSGNPIIGECHAQFSALANIETIYAGCGQDASSQTRQWLRFPAQASLNAVCAHFAELEQGLDILDKPRHCLDFKEFPGSAIDRTRASW